MTVDGVLKARLENFPPKDGEETVLRLPAGPAYSFHHNFQGFRRFPQPPSPAARSFLSLALAGWAADKLHPRKSSPDGWTRSFRLRVPVAAVVAEPMLALTPALSFLTGDRWELEFYPMSETALSLAKSSSSWTPDEICLFSGGVDSLAGAIARLEAGRRLLLVSQHDYGQLAACQAHLAGALEAHYGTECVRHVPLRVQFPVAPEATLRSRSLLFMALGLALASAWGDGIPVIIPENGWISLNPPLTPNRLGSYTTRTTHPFFLSQLRQILPQMGLFNALENPFEFDTKGEILQHSGNPALLRSLLPATISCAHPAVFRWQKQRQGNCGYCFPCLMRRAAMHTIGWDRGEEYGYDAMRDRAVLANRWRGADLRSLLFALKGYEEAPDPASMLLVSGPVDLKGESGAARLRLVATGFAEVKHWLLTSGGEHIRVYGRLAAGGCPVPKCRPQETGAWEDGPGP